MVRSLAQEIVDWGPSLRIFITTPLTSQKNELKCQLIEWTGASCNLLTEAEEGALGSSPWSLDHVPISIQ